ncbi:MAG: metallopeptidase family protein [Planctomycetales bacterium]|nr:metallopeptidase family protein [Planctomycetales bacterium]
MKPDLRDYFDGQVDIVMQSMPARVHELLEEIPLFVEDGPSVDLMHRLGVRHRAHLQGLYTGVPLGDRSVTHSGVMPDVVQIFREGILALATDGRGRIDEDELRRQIRITILHELGHHHGMTEEDLESLGY